MEVSEIKQDDYLLLEVRGRVDASNAPQLEQQLVSLIDGGVTPLVLDFAGLEYLSSAGMRVCLMAAKHMHRAGGKLALAGLSDHIRHVFNLSGFAYRFSFFPDRNEAIKALT